MTMKVPVSTRSSSATVDQRQPPQQRRTKPRQRKQLIPSEQASVPDNPNAKRRDKVFFRTHNEDASAARKHVENHSDRVTRSGASTSLFPWHKDLTYALRSGRWDHVRGQLSLYQTTVLQKHSAEPTHSNKLGTSKEAKRTSRGGFLWKRGSRSLTKENEDEHGGLMSLDGQGRTPLALALSSNSSPVDVILQILQYCPQAAAFPVCTPVGTKPGCRSVHGPQCDCAQCVSQGKRKDGATEQWPLHLAASHEHHLETIAALVDAFPDALAFSDHDGKTPLQYALEIACRNTNLQQAPKHFWMSSTNDKVVQWQDEQSERWGIVHWLLLSSATYQKELTLVSGQESCVENTSQRKAQNDNTMLVNALLAAAPPAVVALLLGASAALLRDEQRASAFASATLYTCLTRHYPVSILQALAQLCPPDVKRVRDETNMGLVAAQFVSGCFEQSRTATQEWSVVPRIWGALRLSLARGVIVKDPGFVDWWEGVEYLIQFCDDDGASDADCTESTKPVLVHAALRNADTPPWVFRMLCLLYPNQLAEHDRRSGALPIHLAAQLSDYIPRNYEFQILDHSSESCTSAASPTQVLVSINRGMIYARHQQRLPLHYAIDAGKTLASLEPLVDHFTLTQRDPFTMLYPFQQAAAYCIGSTNDGWRWSCTARNKYSHAVWKGLTDRQKAEVIWRVAQAEDTERLATIYDLLRRKPSLVSSTRLQSRVSPVKRSLINERDISGVGSQDTSGSGMISEHYMSYLYTKNQAGERCLNSSRFASFEQALLDAKQNGGIMVHASRDFIKWLQKLKFWIRYCEVPSHVPTLRSIPREGDETYLLHSALSNPDTPPRVVELILALYPLSAEKPIPNTTCLPLHVICLTPPSPQSYHTFESQEASSLDLVRLAYPPAARCSSELGLPLHLAIRSGYYWDSLQGLVEEVPNSLATRDPSTSLYPFQLMALPQAKSSKYYVDSHVAAQSQVGDDKWYSLTSRQQSAAIRDVYKSRDLKTLTAIFNLLRSEVTVIEKHLHPQELGIVEEACTQEECITPANGFSQGHHEVQIHSFRDERSLSKSSEEEDTESDAGALNSKDHSEDSEATSYNSSESESETDDDIDSEHGVSQCGEIFSDTSSHTIRQTGKDRPSLMSYFARSSTHNSTRSIGFRGDASVLSGVDVLSLVSGHSNSIQRITTRRGASIASEEQSLNITDLLVDSSSSEESEESEESSEEFAEDTTHAETSTATSENSDVTVVYFLMRRKPVFRRAHVEERESTKQVMLSKKSDEKTSPLRAKSMPIDQRPLPLKNDSLRAMLFNSRHRRECLLPRSLHSATSGSNDSYSSLLPEELGKVGSSTTMVWVSNKVYDATLLGSQQSNSHDSTKEFEESVLSLSSSSSYTSLRKAASITNIKRTDSSRSLRSSSSNMSAASRSVRSKDREKSKLPHSNSSLSLVSHSSHTGKSASSHTRRSGNSSLARHSQSQHSASDASTFIDLLESSCSQTPTGTSSFSTFANDNFDDSAHVWGMNEASRQWKDASNSSNEVKDCFGLPFLDLESADEDCLIIEPAETTNSSARHHSAATHDSTMIYDKSNMRWTKRDGEATIQRSNPSLEQGQSSVGAHGPGVDAYFDKKTMMWLPRSQGPTKSSGETRAVAAKPPLSSSKSTTVDCKSSTSLDTMKLGLPFVDMLPREHMKNKQVGRRIGI